MRAVVSGLVCKGCLPECPGCEVAGQKLFYSAMHAVHWVSQYGHDTAPHSVQSPCVIHVIIRSPSDSANLLQRCSMNHTV